jgi:hypothetical protein
MPTASTNVAALKLEDMTQEQAIAALERYFNSQPPLDPNKDPNPDPLGTWYQNGSTGGFEGNITSEFDPSYDNGEFGSYIGAFDAQGKLVPGSIKFTKGERDHGWLANHIGEVVGAIIIAGTAGMAAELAGLGGVAPAIEAVPAVAGTDATLAAAENGILNSTVGSTGMFTPEVAAAGAGGAAAPIGPATGTNLSYP